MPRQQKSALSDKPNRLVSFAGWAKSSDSDDALTILRDSPTIFSIGSNIDVRNCDERSMRRYGITGRDSGSVNTEALV